MSFLSICRASRPSNGVIAVALIAVATGVLFASAAKAHGPTIEITHAEMKPALLNLFVGTTVHFNNQEWMPGGHTVVDTTGKIESPPLEKVDEGWHYTFDEVGAFELFVKQHPMAKVRVNVVSKKD